MVVILELSVLEPYTFFSGIFLLLSSWFQKLTDGDWLSNSMFSSLCSYLSFSTLRRTCSSLILPPAAPIYLSFVCIIQGEHSTDFFLVDFSFPQHPEHPRKGTAPSGTEETTFLRQSEGTRSNPDGAAVFYCFPRANPSDLRSRRRLLRSSSHRTKISSATLLFSRMRKQQ